MGHKHRSACRRPPYGNILIEAPDGTPMFRCNAKKLRFYTDRNLVEIVGPATARLKFIPNGPGNAGDVFHIGQKYNICVVCGAFEHLSRHHIVPRCYRRLFPYEYKARSHHDVVVMCLKCHHAYEDHAQAKNRLYGPPLEGVGMVIDRDLGQAQICASTLFRYGHRLPANKFELLWLKLDDYFGRRVDYADLPSLWHRPVVDRSNHISHAKIIVDSITDLQQFVNDWRDHFLDTMKPEFMPVGWDARRPIGVDVWTT